MACELAANCDLIYGILTCNKHGSEGPHLTGIHTYKKDRSTQVIKCTSWGTMVKPFPSLQRKMMEYHRERQIIATPLPIGHINPDLRLPQ